MIIIFIFSILCTQSLWGYEKTDWTIMIIMCARNDLAPFAHLNRKQLQKIGSSKNVSVIVQHYGSKDGKGVIDTLYIGKNYEQQLPLLTPQDSSNTMQNIIDFCSYCIKNFPARHYALFFWDHGTGILTPLKKKLHLSALLLSLQRYPLKGVCFDDIQETHLTEKEIAQALNVISTTCLDGGKLDIIGFDACHMAMIEIAYILQPYAKYMVASQETVPGPGWNYEKILKIFTSPSSTISAKKFACHIVQSYQATYPHTSDITLSALQLKRVAGLSTAITTFMHHLTQLSESKIIHFFEYLFKKQRITRDFGEPSFVDIRELCEIFLCNKPLLHKVKNETDELYTIHLKSALDHIIDSLATCIVANVTGNNKKAHGLSIYFPHTIFHTEYNNSQFAQETGWSELVSAYIKSYTKLHDDKKRT